MFLIRVSFSVHDLGELPIKCWNSMMKSRLFAENSNVFAPYMTAFAWKEKSKLGLTWLVR